MYSRWKIVLHNNISHFESVLAVTAISPNDLIIDYYDNTADI